MSSPHIKSIVRLLGPTPPALPPERRKILRVSEKGVCYRLLTGESLFSSAYRLDGSGLFDGRVCDYAVLIGEEADMANASRVLYVELKSGGRNIQHAISQIESVLDDPRLKKATADGVISARVVSMNCGPSGAGLAELEKARLRFKKKYKCDLRSVKSQSNDRL